MSSQTPPAGEPPQDAVPTTPQDAPPPAPFPAPAPAPAPSPPAAPPASRRSSRRWWILTGVGLTVALAGAGGLASRGAFGGGVLPSAEQRQTLTHPVSAVAVRAGSGDVAVQGGAPAGTVLVTRTLHWGPGSGPPSSTETWSGDRLDVGYDCPSGTPFCSIDYTLQVPDGTAVTVDNGSGDVRVAGRLGSLDLTAGSGDIGSTRLSADRVTAHNGSGDTELRFAASPTTVVVESGSGDVTVDVPSGTPYATRISTGSGSPEVDIATDPASGRTIEVKTGSGDIDLGYR